MTTHKRSFPLRSFMSLTLSLGIVLAGFGSAPAPLHAAGFDAGTIVSDGFFTARESMSVADIQNFLIQKGSVLTKVSSSQLGEGAGGRTAAQIIYDAARTNRTDFAHSNGYGSDNPLVMNLNPQVILITLQKEQSLITASYSPGSSQTTNALRTAMGYGCPDGGGCDAIYAGFTNQVVYGAAQLMKNYYKASSSSYKPGQTYTITNTQGPPYNAPASQQVKIGNASTSSLYQYTPHVYNGNYNFWYYQQQWFATTPYTPVLVKDSKGTVYIIESGRRYPVTSAGFKSWALDSADITTATSEQLALPLGAQVKPIAVDNDGSAYLIQSGKKRVITSPRVFAQAGLSWSNSTSLPHSLLSKVPYGVPVYPLSMIVGGDGSVYMATAGRAYPMTGDIYTNAWGYNTYKEIGQVPAYALVNLPKDQALTRLAIAVRTDGTVFLLDRGYGYKVSAAMASAWNLDLSKVRLVDNILLDERGNGGFLTNIVVQAGGDGTVYLVSGGQKRPMTGNYWRSHGYNSGSVKVMSASLLSTLPTGNTLY